MAHSTSPRGAITTKDCPKNPAISSTLQPPSDTPFIIPSTPQQSSLQQYLAVNSHKNPFPFFQPMQSHQFPRVLPKETHLIRDGSSDTINIEMAEAIISLSKAQSTFTHSSTPYSTSSHEDDHEKNFSSLKRSASFTPDERKQNRLQRNRVAAKECRQKKKAYVEDLLAKVRELEEANMILKKENMNLKEERAECKCIPKKVDNKDTLSPDLIKTFTCADTGLDKNSFQTTQTSGYDQSMVDNHHYQTLHYPSLASAIVSGNQALLCSSLPHPSHLLAIHPNSAPILSIQKPMEAHSLDSTQ